MSVASSEGGTRLLTTDRRLLPARPDLAAAWLRGQVVADRFVEGVRRQVGPAVADLRNAPAPDAALDTQALPGEYVQVYEDDEGYAWVQLERDGYVGYLSAAALFTPGPPTTHRVSVRRTFLYPGPNMKLPPLGVLPFGAEISVNGLKGDFALTRHGAIWAGHLVGEAEHAVDFVRVAEGFLHAPYLWGGKTPDGIDCSGLVQSALAAVGIACPRDTDQQVAALGASLDPTTSLRRGDLVFWRGHVGIMQDERRLLHANGFHMLVESEPFDEARTRIAAKSFGEITGVRRLTHGVAP